MTGRALRIDFCCNDPGNGDFAGRVVGASFLECDLEPANYDWGYKFTLTPKGLRLHRRLFPYLGTKAWVGNWSWDSFLFDRAVGLRLLLVLRAQGWRCTGGPARLYDWFNGREEAS
jgi:hypothetical protein